MSWCKGDMVIGVGKNATVYGSTDESVVFKKGDDFSGTNENEYNITKSAFNIFPLRIPRPIDFFKHFDGDNVLVFEFIHGPLASQVDLTESDVMEIITLYFNLMQSGIFQNDLKTDNVIKNTKTNCWMLMDFGIATRRTLDFNDNLEKMALLFLRTLPENSLQMQNIILECIQRLTVRTCVLPTMQLQRVCPPTPRNKKLHSNKKFINVYLFYFKM